MQNKTIIIILLAISWPVNNLHRLLNSHKVLLGNWFLFDGNYISDLQWYVHDICQSASYLCIFIAIWMYMSMLIRKDNDIMSIFKSFIIVQVIDLVHYIGWHRSNELILTFEGLIYIYTALKIIIRNYGQTR